MIIFSRGYILPKEIIQKYYFFLISRKMKPSKMEALIVWGPQILTIELRTLIGKHVTTP